MNSAEKVRHQFMHWMLVDPADGVIRFAGDGERAVIEAVASLHLRASNGEKVPGKEWAAAAYAADYAVSYASAADYAASYASAAAYAAYAAAMASDAAASDAAANADADASAAAAYDAAYDAANADADASAAAAYDAAYDAAKNRQREKMAELSAAASQ